jgi:hypothetical protein
MKIIEVLKSKKSPYTAYIILYLEKDKEWNETNKVFHLALAKGKTEKEINKIVIFALEFWLFQNSEMIGVKWLYLDIIKLEKILLI